MKTISNKEIIKKIQFENPWWGEQAAIDDYFKKMKSRAYLESFYELITEKQVNRAVVLMGPRRVGKTVMIYHAIQQLIDNGVDPKRICYVSIEAPVYIGCSLEEFLRFYFDIFKFNDLKNCYIFFDEVQYLKNWEVHLKNLVDNYRELKFTASGSAAAALRLKSIESGAGRFTNFHLPPLTFYEYLSLLEKNDLVQETVEKHGERTRIKFKTSLIDELNEEFINYLNYGGFPEALFSEAIQGDLQRYIRSDIIDKVLLRDLPSIYGIQDIQELHRLFTMLAYNTGHEVSLDELSKGSGVAKNTIKRYLEYLEAAFLIKIMYRVDQRGKRFKRANYFKVYLTNPSMRCALFEPVTQQHDFMGNMAETAIVSQWLHSTSMANIYYARWRGGFEVDLVYLSRDEISWCVEIKWSNRYFDRPGELKGLLKIGSRDKPIDVSCTTIDKKGDKFVHGVKINFLETSLYCYLLGRNTIKSKNRIKIKQSAT